MNEKTLDTINSTLLSLINTTKEAAGFVAGEIPDVLHQLLVWKLVDSLVGFFTGILMLFLSVYLIRSGYKSWKLAQEEPFNRGYTAQQCAFWFGGVLLCLVSLLIMSLNFDWLQIWLAPKVYLLEYAGKLVSRSS